jgi:rSAM/selenodomain-associated transferase 1
MSVPIPLYLFAKAPEAGKVKTRLERYIGPQACAELALAMLQQSARKVAKFWPGKLVLCVSPASNIPVFEQLSEELGCGIEVQIGAGLGDRMINALNHGISLAGKAVVMGCDVPQITEEIFHHAWRALQAGEHVIGPAADGGFYLLGTYGLPNSAFEGVEWGGNRVLRQVIAQAQAVGHDFHMLSQLRDIDRYEDVVWLATQNLGFERFSQHLD